MSINVGVAFANTGLFGTPEHCEPFVKHAEAVGIESLWTVEHVAVPANYQSAYPYSKDGRMPGTEDAPIPDPLIWLATVAGMTKTIKLGTGILILPQRHPIYVAKEVATLDQMSGGRAILGVGIGWMEEEFSALDIPFKKRVSRTEESISAIRALWQKGPCSFDGAHFQWPALESNPKPRQANGVPIIIGGHVPAAARRAARFGDGFFPAAFNQELIDALVDECKALGRDPADVEITTNAPRGFDRDEVQRLVDAGVNRFIIPPPGFDKDSVRAGLDKVGEVLAGLN